MLSITEAKCKVITPLRMPPSNTVVYYVQHQNIYGGDNPPEDFGYTPEICAGLVDKPNLSLEEIAAAEVHEECGYKVDPSRLRKFSTVIVNECLAAAIGYIYYLEVGDSDIDLAAGGGNADDGEWIEVVYWPIDRIDELLTLTETKIHVSNITILAALWFQLHITISLILEVNFAD
nr:uridine diphosphate glucose pyrophosphatase [Hymenolepis microstoma]